CATLGCGYADTPAKFNLPAISGICTLNDARSGQNVALMEVEYLASLRTGAAGVVAAKNLARKDSRVIGIIGTGSQGRFQLMALREIYKIDLVKAFSRNKAKREA